VYQRLNEYSITFGVRVLSSRNAFSGVFLVAGGTLKKNQYFELGIRFWMYARRELR
jgi:hypothetical protein